MRGQGQDLEQPAATIDIKATTLQTEIALPAQSPVGWIAWASFHVISKDSFHLFGTLNVRMRPKCSCVLRFLLE